MENLSLMKIFILFFMFLLLVHCKPRAAQRKKMSEEKKVLNTKIEQYNTMVATSGGGQQISEEIKQSGRWPWLVTSGIHLFQLHVPDITCILFFTIMYSVGRALHHF